MITGAEEALPGIELIDVTNVGPDGQIIEVMPKELLDMLRQSDARIAEMQRTNTAIIQGYCGGKGWLGTHNVNLDLASGYVTATPFQTNEASP